MTQAVMPDGQITFTRWEYVDKHLGNQQSLWIANPTARACPWPATISARSPSEPFRVPGSRQIAASPRTCRWPVGR